MLKAARNKQGLTQKELALMVGVSVRAIAMYEAKQRSPSPGVALRIAAVLGIPEEKIFEVFYKKTPPT